MKIDGTIDIEAASWDKFAVAAVYDARTQKTEVFRTIGALVDRLLVRRGMTYWAHAGGSYDFLAVAEEMRRRVIPCQVDLAGPRVSRLIGGGIVLRDSWPLIPLPLAQACALAGEYAPVLQLPCRCGRACGGYCEIRPSDPRKAVADYCAADARVLYRVLASLRTYADELGLSLRGTLGGTAWATARDTLKLPETDLPPVMWRRVRDAYYGGRVTICRPRATGPGSHWDISSAYPAALASTSVPIGKWSTYTARDARRCFDNRRPGIYSATVTVPEIYLPPLPTRIGPRICYPIGTFTGDWTHNELQCALARGVTIDSVSWALVWESEAVIFGDLIDKWFRVRARVGKKTPLGEWLRLLPNSLVGKLAEGPDRRSAKMFPNEIRYCRGKRPCSPKLCTGACGAMEQLDMWGQVWGVPFYRPAPSAHVQWAAYVTAATRERWLHGAESQGLDLVYGDTDSLWTTSRVAPSPHGAGLGRWEYKHAWFDWECAAPRAYRYAHQDGARVTKAAGATLKDGDWDRGKATTSRGVLTFVEAAKQSRGLFVRRAQTWTLPKRGRESGWYGDRLLDVEERLTLPVVYGAQESSAEHRA